MSEWLYAQAGQIEPTDSGIWLRVVNPGLHIPTEAFCSSINRLRRFWELAPHMMELVAGNIIAQYQVILDAGRGFELPSDPKDFDEALTAEVRKRMEKKYSETGSLEEATGYNLKRSITNMERWIDTFPQIGNAIRALLESQLTLTWTAFETLSEDLWIQSVRRYHEDEKKPRFRRLATIRESYHQLKNPEIDAILADVGLRKLNLVRNLILHKSGKVDEEFLREASIISWDTKEFEGKVITINGAMVKELANPVIRSSQELIRAIDKWMVMRHVQTEL